MSQAESMGPGAQAEVEAPPALPPSSITVIGGQEDRVQVAAGERGDAEALPVLIGSWMPTQPMRALSPLRYPGSKRKLAPVLRALIKGSGRRPKVFIEPFCGGGSVSLRLLHAGVVDRVILADLDPLVGAFWETAAFDHKWLVKAIWDEEVTLDRWDYWRAAHPRGRRDRALKCFFLNRTTFSGIMHGNAGPIGGRAQTSDYKIDCRFQKAALIERIEYVAALGRAGHIQDVWTTDWQTTLARANDYTRHVSAAATLLYLDPPYVHKASHLYEASFADDEHRDLADSLIELRDRPWILSYDAAPDVTELYRGQPGVRAFSASHHYTTSRGRRRPTPGRELVFTNLPVKAEST